MKVESIKWRQDLKYSYSICS